MLAIYWSVIFDMEVLVETRSKGVRKRSRSDKIGRLKYTLELLKRIDNRLDSFDRRLNRIEQGLKPSFSFEKVFIEEVACRDEVDREILRMLFEAGTTGLLPRDLARQLARFRVSRFQVTRRILQMNKKLNAKLNESVVERVGWHFSLTAFARESWGISEAEVQPAAAVVESEEKWQ